MRSKPVGFHAIVSITFSDWIVWRSLSGTTSSGWSQMSSWPVCR
jgi:hypothetical protein